MFALKLVLIFLFCNIFNIKPFGLDLLLIV